MKVEYLVFIISLFISLIAAEIYVRARMTSVSEAYTVEISDEGWAKFDSKIGWRTEAGAIGRENDAQISINSIGARGEEQGGRPKVLAFGDSFTLGAGISDQWPWPNQLSEMIDKEVANFGVCGYGVDQMYLLWDEYDPLYSANAKTVIFGLISDNFYRTGLRRWVTGQERPLVEIKDGKPHLVSQELKPMGLEGGENHTFYDWPFILFDWSRFYLLGAYDEVSHLNRSPRFYRRALEKSYDILEFVSNEVELQGRDFYVALLSREDQFQFTDIRKELDERGIEYFSCGHALIDDESKLDDGHPSEVGHTRYAKCIAEGIKTSESN